ncbi:glucans biosynthesis glucosyltransferase MdoH [Salinimonas sp. HHU 13199]|uniref:Glucans biosynthesis glucosyltransferase H n=1 Tax=Salinimonas profundi TaxID=2729140 RepID=A0ABR8LMR2_9ALTE|nr:glucans biosynthesis glucosyltransferase MdoH [Salinimonas profundi]MBD3585687.1 glucans biosynthesis glucosyltransferase MdoH [Salinimonas profundi]
MSTSHNKAADRKNPNRLFTRARRFRLIIMLLLVLPTAALATYSLFEIFRPNQLTALEAGQLILAVTLFVWLSMAFWTAIIGFVLKLLRIDPLSLRRELKPVATDAPLKKRHAIIMPVYNEDTRRIMVGFEACVREMLATPDADKFDFYMLSDTRDAELAKAERESWQALEKRITEARGRLFYRRREKNIGRKVGNVTDFCERWGAQYEGMIVLDADSVMSGTRMRDLARRLEFNDDVALIQTIPMPVRQHSFFGRFVQFAAHLYSPMLATGLSFWQTDSANYWGHNAIIRIEPFMAHCGLPQVPGRAPFGGDILSHDFVEAALLRRAGWQCYLITDTDGSYEEVPANMIDYAIRDRRWVQGNIQHLGLLSIRGLKTTNRLHFLFGAFAYISSIILFAVLMLGTADAIIRATTLPDFFASRYQLFPDWPIAKEKMMLWTLWGTIALLFLPKILGILLAMIQRRKDFGGLFALFKGGTVELCMAVLIAPVMMFYHSYFVLSVLIGHKVRWDAQAREGRMVPWKDAFAYTRWMTLLAIIWGAVTAWYTPTLFLWLLPVLTGMFFGAPIIRLTSSETFGLTCRRLGIFVIAEEHNENSSLVRVRQDMPSFSLSGIDAPVPALPAERHQPMPVQDFKKKPLPMRSALPVAR